MRILLVDDDPAIRQLIELNIELEGTAAEIFHAEHGDDAVQLCEEVRPDALVVDGHMPGLTGDALGEALRALVPHARIVSFTGVPGEVEWADTQVVKATDDALHQVIERLLETP